MIDYNRLATVTWTKQPFWFETQNTPDEEHCDELTLKQAVAFVIEHLDAGCLKSVIVRCGTEKYNFFDIESMYVDLGLLWRYSLLVSRLAWLAPYLAAPDLSEAGGPDQPS